MKDIQDVDLKNKIALLKLQKQAQLRDQASHESPRKNLPHSRNASEEKVLCESPLYHNLPVSRDPEDTPSTRKVTRDKKGGTLPAIPNAYGVQPT